MMRLVEYIKNFLQDLDDQHFYMVLGVLLFSILLFSGMLIFNTVRSKHTAELQLEEINEQRRSVQILLGRYNQVQKQKASVNALLAREKGFKIFGYFTELLDELGLRRNLKQEPDEPKLESVGKDYTEYILTGVLGRLSMKQLTDLLQKIDNNELVYPKRLEITKADGMPPAIDVTISIATLAPTVE